MGGNLTGGLAQGGIELTYKVLRVFVLCSMLGTVSGSTNPYPCV